VIDARLLEELHRISSERVAETLEVVTSLESLSIGHENARLSLKAFHDRLQRRASRMDAANRTSPKTTATAARPARTQPGRRQRRRSGGVTQQAGLKPRPCGIEDGCVFREDSNSRACS